MIFLLSLRYITFETAITAQKDDYEIVCCRFINTNNKESGGAISDTRIASKLFIEGTFFDNCTSNMNGGAIYSNNYQCQEKNTFTNCLAFGDGHVSYTLSNQDYMLTSECVAVSCPKQTRISDGSTFYFLSSDNYLSLCNISKCSSKSKSGGFYLSTPRNTIIEYSILDNCEGQHIFYQSTTAVQSKFNFSIIINNLKIDSTLFFIQSPLVVESSYFYNNIKHICGNYLTEREKLTLRNCSIPNLDEIPDIFTKVDCIEASYSIINERTIDYISYCATSEDNSTNSTTLHSSSVGKVLILIYAVAAIITAVVIHHCIKRARRNRGIEDEMNLEMIRDGEIVILDVDENQNKDQDQNNSPLPEEN